MNEFIKAAGWEQEAVVIWWPEAHEEPLGILHILFAKRDLKAFQNFVLQLDWKTMRDDWCVRSAKRGPLALFGRTCVPKTRWEGSNPTQRDAKSMPKICIFFFVGWSQPSWQTAPSNISDFSLFAERLQRYLAICAFYMLLTFYLFYKIWI